jgi:hypothetical protein
MNINIRFTILLFIRDTQCNNRASKAEVQARIRIKAEKDLNAVVDKARIVRRLPLESMNSLLSFLYTLLTNNVTLRWKRSVSTRMLDSCTKTTLDAPPW